MGERDAEIAALKQDLAALRKREQDLTDFIENASLALHWVGPDGIIIWANQAELDLLGYCRDEYVGHHIAEFHLDPPVLDDILRRLKQGETLRDYEARLRCKDGMPCYVLISSNVRRNQEQQFVHTRCFTRDITERKRYEQRLLTQYEVGRLLANATSLDSVAPKLLELINKGLGWQVGLLWTLDEQQQVLCCRAHAEGPVRTGGGFATISERLTLAPGVGLPGRVWSTRAPAWIADLATDHNFPRLGVAAEQGLRSAFAFPILLGDRVFGVMEFFAEHLRSPDDALLQTGGSLGYQIGEFLERTDAQQRLAERGESYRVLTETASDGIITIDATSTILFANTAAANLFGYSAAELIGAALTLLIPERLRELHTTAMARYLETGKRHLTWQAIRLTGEHRDGHEFPIEVSFGEYHEARKHVFVGVIRDITERTRLDEQLRHTAKLESLGVLAGGIAHDFNNLLTGILGNVSLALDAQEPANPIRSVLEGAIEASERAAHLTKQLLAYAGKGRFLIEVMDVSSLVREISALITSAIPKHVAVRLDFQQPIALVEADVAQLQQLIMNLVINGAEAIPAERQGIVVVMTRNQLITAEYLETMRIEDLRPGDYVTIMVHDNGVGMDEATLGKIFDPFFTTKFTGRGLGLAAVLGIVQGHKGALKVFSTPGQGTTFKLLLPVSAAAVRHTSPPARAPRDLAGRGIVLIVDDEPVVRKLAATALKSYGYTVITADNGRDGLDRFRELHPNLKVVLLDMTMPVMSGEEALGKMRLINEHVPIILSSGFNEVEATRRFTGRGLAGFIQKPYTAAALAEKVQTVIREHTSRDR